MKISKITINNFKSIGEDKNRIRLESGVTALIGKNESGKSNVLDVISAITFETAVKSVANNKNRTANNDVSYTVELFTLPKEVSKLGLNEDVLTTVTAKRSLFRNHTLRI